jgi:hypothetical protein
MRVEEATLHSFFRLQARLVETRETIIGGKEVKKIGISSNPTVVG